MNRLKALREEKGVSLTEISESLGIPYQTYRNYEIGKRKPKNQEIWEKLADYFNVPVPYIMGLSMHRVFKEKEDLDQYVDNLKKQDKRKTGTMITVTDFDTESTTYSAVIHDDVINNIFKELSDDNKLIVITLADALRKAQLLDKQHDLKNER